MTVLVIDGFEVVYVDDCKADIVFVLSINFLKDASVVNACKGIVLCLEGKHFLVSSVSFIDDDHEYQDGYFILLLPRVK